jgi:hypothetical protein
VFGLRVPYEWPWGWGTAFGRESAGHGETIYEQRFPTRFPDPLLVVNMNIRVRGIRFPVPGRYEFLLYVDSDPVVQRTLRVRSL